MKKGFFLRRADSRSHFGPSARQSARRSGKLLARSRRSGLRFSIEDNRPTSACHASAKPRAAGENSPTPANPRSSLAPLPAPPRDTDAPRHIHLVRNSEPRFATIKMKLMNRERRCVRSGRVGRAPSGARRADAVWRTRREGRAGRGAGSAATKPRTGIRGCGRRERSHGERERGRGRPARPRLRPKAEIAGAQRRPTADATNSTRDRQRGALRGRSGADRFLDEASWAGLRPAADLAVAARPSGRPSRPPGSGSTVAPKRAARRQTTGCVRQANDADNLQRADHLFTP